MLLAAAVMALATGCAAGRGRREGARWPAGGAAPKLVLLPIENLGAAPVPARELTEETERSLRAAGVELAPEDAVEAFLATHRVRYTGGIDRPLAAAARDELGADGVIVTTLERYSEASAPQIAMTMRLVAAGPEPIIVWMDSVSRAGDAAPGLFGLGHVGSMRALRGEAVSALSRSLAAFLDGRRLPAERCAPGSRFEPRASFRSKLFEPGQAYSVAVLPFLNDTERRDAGNVVSLAFVRELAAVERFRVLEPGVVRDALLRLRVIQEGGVSLEDARLLTHSLDADLVLAGVVHGYRESADRSAAPGVEFTVMLIRKWTREVVWQSSSHAGGHDGTRLFGTGKVATASALACRMVRTVVDRMNAAGAAD